MKTRKLLFVIIYLFSIGWAVGQVEEICTDFNDGTKQGWQNWNTYSYITSPGLDGTRFLLIGDRSFASFEYNTVYRGNWEIHNGKCLCFDYKVFNDGTYDVINIHPTVSIYIGYPVGNSLMATFTANIAVTERDEWVHVCAPIEFNNGVDMPSNSEGKWKMVRGTPANWNTLLSNVSGIAFSPEFSSFQSEQIGIDNICIQDCPIPEPTNEGAYCCEGENLVKNGNFEAGVNDFGSDYTQDGSTDPGEYDVTTTASAFGTTITDHSNCVDPVNYPNNKNYLLVNGKTQQTGKSVIWEQTIDVEDWKGYKFCFQAKNLDQCTFNIAPVLDIEFSMPVGNMTQTISAPVGPCGWQEISKGIDLWGYGTSLTIKILLDESGNGDGNDLAIDDISLIQLEQCPASTALFDITTITVPQQNYYSVSATAQIVAPCESVWWGVCEYDWGASNCISGTELNGQWWTTTTDFTGYDGTSTNNNSGSPGQFEYGKLYRITRGSWGECDSWNQSSKFVAAFGKEEIMVYSEEEFNALDKTDLKQKLGVINQSEDEMKIYPNPAKHQFTISILNETISSIEILSVSGQKVFTKQLERGNNEETIDISSLASGMYFVRVTGVNQKQYTANVIKE